MTTYQSTYHLSVPQELYDEVSDACGQPFADSYLFGATLTGRSLWPRTVTGWGRMKASREFMEVLGAMALKLEKPLPFNPNDGRPSAADLGFQPKPHRRAA